MSTARLAPDLFSADLDLGTGLDGRPLVEHRPTGRCALLSPEAGRLLGFARRHSDLDAAGAAVAGRLGCTRERADGALAELQDLLSDARLVAERPGRDEGRQRRWLALWLATVPTARVVRLRLAAPGAPGPRRRLSPAAVRLWLAVPPLLGALAAVLVVRAGHRTPGAATALVSRVPHTGLDAGAALTAALPLLALLGLTMLANVCHEAAHAVTCRLLGVAVQEAGLALWWGVLPLWYVEHRGLARLRARADHALVALAGPATHAGMASAAALAALTLPPGTADTVAAAGSQVLGVAALLNLNPLLPNDGYRAVEALTGRVGFRVTAIGTVARSLLLVNRGHVPRLRPLAVLAHYCYVLGCLAWALIVGLSLVHLLTAGAMP